LKKLLIYLNRLARLLKPVRYVLAGLTFIALLLVTYSLLVRTAFSLNILEPAIVAALWGMLLLASTEIFQKLPDPVLSTDSFFQRVLSRCKLLFFTLMALIIFLVSALLTWLSLRLLLI
jgi:hypothetical protein